MLEVGQLEKGRRTDERVLTHESIDTLQPSGATCQAEESSLLDSFEKELDDKGETRIQPQRKLLDQG